MNFNQILDSIRDAMIGNNTHDAILAVGIAALPVLLFLWIVNRQRHPERPFLPLLPSRGRQRRGTARATEPERWT